jgi:predicted GNAT family acetyltransferase
MDSLFRVLKESYEMMLNENTFEDVKNICKEKGVELDAYISARSPNKIELSRIFVPKQLRGQGLGSFAMKLLISYANEHKMVITLSPSTDFGASSVSRLNKYYKSFGFVDNKGRNKDFTISNTMYKLPN